MTRLALLVLAVAASACASRPPADGTEPWIRAELWLGAEIPSGGEVTDAAWEDFVAREVASRFPAGFSVLEAQGRWREEAGEEVRERTRVLVILHPAGDTAAAEAIEAIAEAYVERFGQEAALRTTDPVGVRFVRP